MKKFIMIAAAAMSLMFSSCGTTNNESSNKEEIVDQNENNRFQIVYSQWMYDDDAYYSCGITVFVDTVTGVKYIAFKRGYGTGLTKLEE